MITYLYNNHLYSEKIAIIDLQKSEFLKHFVIQKGDILQLKDGRVVVANSIEINAQNVIIVEYLVLKINLQVSVRKRKICSDKIDYILKEKDFLEYKDFTPLKRIHY